MIVSMRDNPGAMEAIMAGQSGYYINHDVINAQANNPHLSEQTRMFYQQKQEHFVHMEAFVETRLQETQTGEAVVYPLTNIDYLPLAKGNMRTYIMAHPGTLERSGDIGDLFTNQPLVGDAKIIGEGNIAWERVMDGVMAVDEDHIVRIECTEIDKIIPPLNPTEQGYVQTTWETLETLEDEDEETFQNSFKDLTFY